METFAIVLFVVGGVLILIALILILCLYYRTRWRNRKGKSSSDSFKVIYKPSKKTPPQALTTIEPQYIVANNGTLVSSKPKSVVSSHSHTDGVTLIPATVVIPAGSTMSLDKHNKKQKHRIHSDSSAHRVVYAGSHLGTTARYVETNSRRAHDRPQQRYASSYAYGTTGNHHRSSPEIGPVILQGDVKSGRLKVLEEMPRDRQVRTWLHRQHSSGMVRAGSNDAIDADQPSLNSDVFDGSGNERPKTPNPLVMRWSPSMGQKIYKRSEIETVTHSGDTRTLPSHIERKYVYPQYQSGKAMSSL